MSQLAVILILGSAMMHASWNLLTKRAGGGSTFVWLYATVALCVYAPLLVAYLVTHAVVVTPVGGLFICLSSVLHLLYFLVLQEGYQVGDLSLVYPLARGTGPTLATAGAILLLGERPSALTLSGTALVVAGVILLTWSGCRSETAARPRKAIVFGFLCGLLIASFTVCDKYVVDQLGMSPLLLTMLFTLGVSVMLTPHAFRRWPEVRRDWTDRRREIFGVALLYPGAYLMVLLAMQFTPLSYVAPAREISILFGATMGTRLLGEGNSLRRILAACAMVAGLFVLMLS